MAISTLFTNKAVVDKVTKESRLFQSEEKLLGKFHVKNLMKKVCMDKKLSLEQSAATWKWWRTAICKFFLIIIILGTAGGRCSQYIICKMLFCVMKCKNCSKSHITCLALQWCCLILHSQPHSICSSISISAQILSHFVSWMLHCASRTWKSTRKCH